MEFVANTQNGKMNEVQVSHRRLHCAWNTSMGSSNRLAPNRWQGFIWTNFSLVYKRIYMCTVYMFIFAAFIWWYNSIRSGIDIEMKMNSYFTKVFLLETWTHQKLPLWVITVHLAVNKWDRENSVAGVVLGMGSANERRCYIVASTLRRNIVTSSLTGWAHNLKNPCVGRREYSSI